MSQYTERPGDGPDEDVVALLRAMYSPPQGEAYWEGLEARILSKVAGDRGSVWPFFARWAPAGLIAAAAALLMAGYALQRLNEEEASVAYETAIRNASPLAVQTVMGRPGTPVREATFEYVITH